MSILRGVYADLRDRRLWPIAVGLLLALVAVPTLLAKPTKESGTEGTAAPAATPAAIATETQPVVSLSTTQGKNNRRRLNHFQRKNPFVQQALQKASTNNLTTPLGTTGTPGVAAVPGGGTIPGGGTAPTTGGTAPTTTAPKKTTTTLYYYNAVVRFGEVGKGKASEVERLEELPSGDNPVTVFLGVTIDDKKALFLVSKTATARGDGKCQPTEDECSFISMKKGDVEFFEVPNDTGDAVVTYELDYVRPKLRAGDKLSAKASERASDTTAQASSKSERQKQRERDARAARQFFSTLSLLGE
jgi:hypothetical protein